VSRLRQFPALVGRAEEGQLTVLASDAGGVQIFPHTPGERHGSSIEFLALRPGRVKVLDPFAA
jgi:hypothetical protein